MELQERCMESNWKQLSTQRKCLEELEQSCRQWEVKQEEVLLEKNAINEALCQKLKDANYISSYGPKIEKNAISTSHKDKLLARVRAKR